MPWPVRLSSGHAAQHQRTRLPASAPLTRVQFEVTRHVDAFDGHTRTTAVRKCHRSSDRFVYEASDGRDAHMHCQFFSMSRECEVMFRHARLHKGKVDKNGVSRAKRGGGDGVLILNLVDITR